MTIADNLTALANQKLGYQDSVEACKVSLSNKDVNVPSGAKLADISGLIDEIQQGGTGDWIRPADWLKIDNIVADGEQKTVGLYAVYPNVNDKGMTNTVAFQVTGNYTVDWGDGIVENFNSNTVAEHVYDYNSLSISTECSRGYRQAIITITAQAGALITNLQFGRKHSSVVFGRISSQWLDLVISGTDLSTFTMQANNVFPNLLESVKAMQSINKCTSMGSMFYNCYSLQSLDLSGFNTASVTNMSYMFYGCFSLQSLDLSGFNTASVTNMLYMFYSCCSLQSLDLSSFNTENVVNMAIMFNGCSSLQSLNLSSFNTASVTNMSYMFGGCYSLQLLDLSSFNTTIVTTMANMFQNCSSLQSLNLSSFNTASVTNMSYMFQNCSSLQSLNLSSTTLAAVVLSANFTGFAASTISLTKCRLPNVKLSFTVASNPLSATELNLLFGDLFDLTGQTSQTITITGCTGAATCDKTIAINKNWTVIG